MLTKKPNYSHAECAALPIWRFELQSLNGNVDIASTYNIVDEKRFGYSDSLKVDLISLENLSSDTILKNAHPKTPFPYDMFVGSRYAFMNWTCKTRQKTIGNG